MSQNDEFAGLTKSQLDEIDKTCDRFEGCIKRGFPPSLERFVENANPMLQLSLFIELLHVEIDVRYRRGDVIAVDEYKLRFPRWAAEVESAFSDFDSFVQSSNKHVANMIRQDDAEQSQLRSPNQAGIGKHVRDKTE